MKDKEMREFLWDLYYLVEANVPIKEAFETMIDTNKKHNEFYIKVVDSLAEGATLADGLKEAGFNNSYYINLIDISEKGSFLKEMLYDICNLLEEQEKIKSLLKSSLIYPAILMIFALITMVFTFTYVIPSVSNIYTVLGVEQNIAVKVILRINILYPVLMGLGLFITHTYFKIKREDYHRIFLVGSLIQNLDKFLYYKMLTNLLHRGIPLYQALEIFSDYPRKQLTKLWATIKEGLYSGMTFNKAVENAGGESPLVINFIKISEQGDDLASGTKRCEVFYQKSLEKKLLYFSKVFEPMVIAVVGITVTTVVLTLLLPLYQLFQNM
ncbi:type II secretion system F family protein [Alkalicella caledoniensis]|uniref:Type II secretion system F family protein n=1 Tax=Alkalicella caledoniensis TaxID=2731377 RepID=A0A7G9WBN1_ALKCA|nr:type II secretion system F family protein [Alkalicella caledoniensis]QNO16093.1 type II secretion system F family protein [Alkalicella caledoniensis]